MTFQPPFYVGIDVGGTNIKCGVVDDLGQTMAMATVPTEATRGLEVGLQKFRELFDRVLADAQLKPSDIRGIGLATPGTMDIPAGKLLSPANLPGWHFSPIRDLCAERLGIQTVLQNDANAAAYGEFWVGAGRAANSLVFWTLGTGIGCGIIIHDLIIEGAHSHGAESGHIIIEMTNGRLCGTGQYGTLEAYAGAKAVVARCQDELDAGRPSSIRERLAQGHPLTPKLISEEAGQGDELATDIVLQTARYLGIGTVTLMHTIDPEMVLIGGAMTFGANNTPLGKRFLSEVIREVHLRSFPTLAQGTHIDFASLGGDAGYIGAAGCARLKFGGPGTGPQPAASYVD